MGGVYGHLRDFVAGAFQNAVALVARVFLGLHQHALGLGAGVFQHFAGVGLSLLHALGVLLLDFRVRAFEPVLIIGIQGLRLAGFFRRVVRHALVFLRAFIHKPLHRLEQQQIQPGNQNHQVERVQKDLLPVDIQGHIHLAVSPLLTARR